MDRSFEQAPQRANPSTGATGQGGRVPSKWQLLKVVEEIRAPLGLKGTSIAVLRALLSFIRSDDISAARHEMHVCFASNAKLAERAHVSLQTVERHIAKLVAMGLITRLPSGNGKRWARRDAEGRIVYASGLSVLPLAQRHDEFATRAQDHKAQQLKLQLLRDQCVGKLAELVDCAPGSARALALKARGRTLLRRKPNSEVLNSLLSEIIEELEGLGRKETKEMRGDAHQNEGHKETPLTQSLQKENPKPVQTSQQDMERFFPRLCSELRFAPSQQACQRHMDDLSNQMGLGNLWFEIKDLGPALSFVVLGYLLERIETIQTPRAYAWRILNDLKSGKIAWESLLRRPERGFGTKKGTEAPAAVQRELREGLVL